MVAHYKSLGILPADSMKEEDWMSIASTHKYFGSPLNPPSAGTAKEEEGSTLEIPTTDAADAALVGGGDGDDER